MSTEEIPSTHATPAGADSSKPQRNNGTDDRTYRLMFERNPLPMWVFDVVTLRFLAVNEAAILHYGYSRAEFLSMTLADIRPAEDIPRLLETIAAARTVADTSGQWRHVRKDGSLIDVEITSSEIVFEGRPARLALVNDITERNKTEEKLRYQLHLTNTISDRAKEAFFLMDGEGRVTFMNPSAEEMFGWKKGELVGKILHDAIHYQHPDGTPFPLDTCPLGRVMTSGQAVHRHEDVFYARDGQPVFVSCSNAPVLEEGRITGAVLVVSDITSSRQARQALYESEERLRLAIRAAEAGHWYFDSGAATGFWSDECWRLYGLEPRPEAPTLDLWLSLIAPEDREHCERAVQEAIRTRSEFNVEYRLAQPKGGGRWLVSIGSIVSGLEEPHIRITGITLDVTGRKRAEEERARLSTEVTEQRLRLANIVSSVPGVVWEAWGQPDAAAQRINFVSDYVETMLGYTVEEWTSEPNFWLRIVHPDDREQAARTAAEHFAQGGPGGNRFRWVAKDGRVLWVESRSTIIADATGQPVGMRGVTLDVTERRQSEETLARYRLLSRLSRDIMLFVRPDGRIVEANDAAAAAYGYERDELLGKTLRDLRAPETLPLLSGQMRQADEAGILFETMHRRRDGSLFPVEVSATGADVGGERLILSIIRDITNRKRAEEELRRSQQLFEGVAEAIPDVLYLYDLSEHRVTYANREVANVLGYTPEQATAMGSELFALLMHPEDLRRVPEHLARLAALRDGEVEEFEFRMRHARGGYRWLLSRDVVFTRTPEGRVRLTCGVTQDVTMRRLGLKLIEGQSRVLEMLSAGEPLEVILEEIVRVIEEQSGEMLCSVLLMNDDGATLRRGAAPSLPRAYFEKAEGLPVGPSNGCCGTAAFRREPVVVEDIATDPLWDEHRDLALSHGLRACWSTPVLSTTGQVLATFGVYYREPRGPRADERRLVEAATHMAGIAVERRRAEERLRESEERLRLSQEVGHIGTFDWHVPTGKVVWTEEEERLFGLEPGTFEGNIEGWATRVAPEDLAKMQAEMRQAMARGDKAMDFDFRIVRPDGSVRCIEGSGRFTYDAAGNPLHMVGVNVDVSERRRAEEEREQSLVREQQARREAEEANRLKDEFLATLSHELRTPLTAILGWAQMLGSGMLQAETVKRAVEVIRRNAESQKQIIDDILDASRIITGKLRVVPEDVDLLNVVREALDSVRPAAAAKGVELICNFDPRTGTIVGDPHRLRQVVWNLLANAVKFTDRGGRVKVEAGRLLSSVRLTVSDTGAGIAPEFLPYVFDRFRQQDGSTTRQHGGLGLGLSIVRHLVEAHGGSVHAFSGGEGQGASFTVELPLPAASAQSPHEEAGEGRSNGTGTNDAGPTGASEVPPALLGLRVLLVDDDRDTLDLLTILLRQNGAEVAAVSTASSALEALGAARPDIIISDIGMPFMDGYELMRRVRSLTQEQGGLIPAIALTAYATDGDKVQAVRAGFQTHVSKPVDPEALLAAVVGLAARAGADAFD